MADSNTQFFRRPRTSTEVGERNISVQVSRAVKDGKLNKASLVFYYRPGWFDRLGDAWETRDAYLHDVLTFIRQYHVVANAKGLEGDPVRLRKVSNSLRMLVGSLIAQADEIDRRAELLEVEQEATTEAAD